MGKGSFIKRNSSFTCEQYGDSTQLLYLRARHYSPTDGRFTSRDTWSGDVNRPLSLNRWMYGYGNPVKYVDPSGNVPCIPSSDYKCPPTWPSAPYHRFDRTLDYMYDEMERNSQGNSAKLIKSMLENDCFNYPLPYNAQVSAYTNFFTLTRPGGQWDHKWQLRPLLKMRNGSMADEYFPIRGNEEFEYYFDIWSNIHFGYVGASIGFPTQGLENIPDLYNRVHPLLRDLIKPLLGSNGPGDVISVKIGIALWESHRYGIKKHHYHRCNIK
jgi:RHS repeat-associated protein